MSDSAPTSSETITVTLTVNGRENSVSVDARTLLSDLLRDELGLTGTHLGCEHGVCGACTVIMNDRPVRSCLMLGVQAEGASIETVEGMAEGEGDDDLHPLQKAFWKEHGLQCGFCTPGMLMAALHLLRNNPDPDREQIRISLSGNLCRCTGYENIVDAVERAASEMSADTSPES